MVLLHEFRAVLLNSASASVTFTLEDLCLVDVVGNLGACIPVGRFGRMPEGWIASGSKFGVCVSSKLTKSWVGPDLPEGWREMVLGECVSKGWRSNEGIVGGTELNVFLPGEWLSRMFGGR